MLIRIAETNEVKELRALDRKTGVEWTKDLVEAGGLQRDDEGIHIMSQVNYGWWRQYLSDMDADEGELSDLTDELRRLGVDNATDEVRDIVADYLAYMDMEDHHKGRQRAIAEIRERHGLIASELEAAQ
jgi:hypothetical protein